MRLEKSTSSILNWKAKPIDKETVRIQNKIERKMEGRERAKNNI